jgi:hypothetical protein
MATVLVESYESCACRSDLAAVAARVRAAAAAAGLTYVRSIFVPADETCFHVFEAPSADAVRTALERAQLTPQRVVEAVAREPYPLPDPPENKERGS